MCDGRRTTNDAALVAAVERRDQGALAELYTRHGVAALAVARRVLSDRVLAEEVVQEVFLRLWRLPERYDAARGPLRSFLLAQVHGRSVDVLRAENARRSRELRDAFRSPRSDDTLEREVVALQTGYREVAVILEEPEGTVKSRIRSGLQRLKPVLLGAGICA
jgi:RNA polymerase sigma-70 factor (ECF subfamily)